MTLPSLLFALLNFAMSNATPAPRYALYQDRVLKVDFEKNNLVNAHEIYPEFSPGQIVLPLDMVQLATSTRGAAVDENSMLVQVPATFGEQALVEDAGHFRLSPINRLRFVVNPSPWQNRRVQMRDGRIAFVTAELSDGHVLIEGRIMAAFGLTLLPDTRDLEQAVLKSLSYLNIFAEIRAGRLLDLRNSGARVLFWLYARTQLHGNSGRSIADEFARLNNLNVRVAAPRAPLIFYSHQRTLRLRVLNAQERALYNPAYIHVQIEDPNHQPLGRFALAAGNDQMILVDSVVGALKVSEISDALNVMIKAWFEPNNLQLVTRPPLNIFNSEYRLARENHASAINLHTAFTMSFNEIMKRNFKRNASPYNRDTFFPDAAPARPNREIKVSLWRARNEIRWQAEKIEVPDGVLNYAIEVERIRQRLAKLNGEIASSLGPWFDPTCQNALDHDHDH